MLIERCDLEPVGSTLERPELFFAFVGAVGTPIGKVADGLRDQLRRYGYDSTAVRLSSVMRATKLASQLDRTDEHKRVSTSMSVGDEIRRRSKRGDALVGLALSEIKARRKAVADRAGKDSQTPDVNRAYLLSSLKHPDEVDSLRAVYGNHLVVAGVHADRATRVNNLAADLSRADGGRASDHRMHAEELMHADEGKDGDNWGQNTRDTFPMADYFVNGSSSTDLAAQIERLVWLVFGRPCVTPTLEEMGMLHATSASWRSAALGRQVGAAVLDEMGDVLAIGMNEVPKAHGGHYWPTDHDDARDFKRGVDANDEQKKRLVTETMRLLREAGWLVQEKSELEIDTLATEAFEGPLRRGGIRALTEFGRDVHAEMSAIVSAARRGVALRDAVLFCTTYPCHNCAKHIVAAGIAEVVYIEPYAKSFATELHDDAIAQNAPKTDGKVGFRSFSGAAPRMHNLWFSMGSTKRKTSDGKLIQWTEASADPRFKFTDSGYITRERELVDAIREELVQADLVDDDPHGGPRDPDDEQRED